MKILTQNTLATADLRTLFPDVRKTQALIVPSTFFAEFSTAELPALFPHEQLVLAAIARVTAPATVLEFGTGQEFSAFLWAENTPQKTEIHTVDLHTDARGDYSAKILRGDIDVGRVYHGSSLSTKVRQILIEPSSTEPEALTSLQGLCDLIFIDGDHSYDGVRKDTEQALTLCHDETVFLWHDFYRFPSYIADTPKRGVYHYLNELAESGRLVLYHIAGTYLVVGRKSWPHSVEAEVRQPGDGDSVMAKRITRLGEF